MPRVKVDKELILKVAKNARLNLSEEEVKKFLPQLQEILEAFSKIDELNVEKAKPSFQPLEQKNVWRKDAVKECLSQEEALSLTKHKKNGYFKGPRVV
ncbi:MAG: Asp-tRNA(Asn)/Glu-tRNA(Gln) amidotransferase subunit GatC [Candidatus Diapherotrites archaeon]|uniref:Aspartyl/glutamyl-tRNA(Asn/Gln) amidotransferase subunit C n=1 Tax=Candidatus Iainarchaeum sp. TaxID=3101447 RepID=A0A7J4JVJ6_9ARCH|nr:MAG: aspartyl-tRNA(Asn)/glutamyl-tRNA (Gln) amidotransferase subunit C [archaeon GW2011_AR21]MBS3058029.1 Asp-tRNA(Asn)/Glu-tRNA(Gln) amidotransferase subunit GatC [Candidatus Diapherotrites archaeon]HIH21494.1 Asp-tRNA(Asn)/Glu-tRNA(Gln) amidotransferase subunit GatC [Candidatus Diapherotrites archaeon]HIH32917.1 Asp-tRNA(Asn)/Glu-tRNA(Gln) amidotransferase subunit GatC [Candidatus Diapherotrites archaeon]